MVEFVSAVGSVGMLHQRLTNALRGCGDGRRSRWSLLRRGLPLIRTRPLPADHDRFGDPADRPNLLIGKVRWSRRELHRGLIFVLAGCGLLSGRRGFAEGPTGTDDSPIQADSPVQADSPIQADSLDLSERQAKSSVEWLTSVALKKLPRTIDGDKDWGDTKRLWAGVDVKRDGWKLKTHRKYRHVEHGRWIKYSVTLPDASLGPVANVVIHRVVPTQDPLTGYRRWRVESTVTAPMKFTARVQRWNLGVRLFSLTIEGDIQVQLLSSANMGFLADYTEVPPALVIEPHVNQAHLRLQRFEVNRVSHIGGDAAEHWGDMVEELIVERLVRKQNDKLVGKLNRAIAKERDDLRFSLADWFQQQW